MKLYKNINNYTCRKVRGATYCENLTAESEIHNKIEKPPADLDSKSPLFVATVSCGFPSPAEDYVDSVLDLNEHLILKPAATFFVRAKGDSMTGAGIYEGDLLIIDRSVKARSGHVVLAIVNGEFTLKRLQISELHRHSGSQVNLCAENPKYKPILISPEMEFEIWGVAIHCIHKLI